MIESPQTIRVSRDGVTGDATIRWHYDRGHWVVSVDSTEFDRVEARADDAFEACCLVREQLEPDGWRLGVAGAQPGVWPSGMARDQGGGLTAYRMTVHGAAGVVDTFEPVDPATATTVGEQRAEIDRLDEERHRSAQDG